MHLNYHLLTQFLLICMPISSLSAFLGQSCSSDSDCYTSNSHCSVQAGTCQCSTGYAKYFTSCKIELGSTCDQNGPADQCSGINTQCSSGSTSGYICQCQSGYYKHGPSCYPKKVVGKTCSDNVECVTGAECVSTVCRCGTSYYVTNSNGCNRKVDLNNNCAHGETKFQCSVINSECTYGQSNYTCRCQDGYYQNNNGACVSKISYNSICSIGESNDQCLDNNAVCTLYTQQQKYYCLCDARHFRYSDQCQSTDQLMAQNVQATDITKYRMTVTWDLPSSNLQPYISEYQVDVSPSNQQKTLDKLSNEVNLSNLEPATEYTIQITTALTEQEKTVLTTLTVRTLSTDDSTTTIAVIVSVVCVVAIVTAIIIFIFWMRRRKRTTGKDATTEPRVIYENQAFQNELIEEGAV